MIKQDLDSLLTTIDVTILPTLKALKKSRGKKPVTGRFLSTYLKHLGASGRTLSDVITATEGFMSNMKTQIVQLDGILDSKGEIEDNYLKLEMAVIATDNMTQGVMFTTSMLSTFFLDSIPKAKRVAMENDLTTYLRLYDFLESHDIAKEIKGLDSSVSAGLLSNFISKDALYFMTSFNGNPFYFIGKVRNRIQKAQMDKLRREIELLNYESLNMERRSEDSATSREYYKKLIVENEMELKRLKEL